MRKVSGIYKITNSVTTDFYIGSSIDVKKRWANHKSPSMRKKYPSSKLYNDIAHYGLANFIFEVIEETYNLKEREQYWMNKLHPTYNKARSYGLDTERLRAYKKNYNIAHKDEIRINKKEYYKAHQSKLKYYAKEHRKSHQAYYEEWERIHQAERRAYRKAYYSRICIYNGETLTLRALINRFNRSNISHATVEAKKYLIIQEDRID